MCYMDMDTYSLKHTHYAAKFLPKYCYMHCRYMYMYLILTYCTDEVV